MNPLARLRFRLAALLLLAPVLATLPTPVVEAAAQKPGQAGNGTTVSIADKTAGMERLDGYMPLYWDSASGSLYMEIARLDEDSR